MKLPHFLSSYLKQSKELLETHDESRAMSLAVGGDYEAVGALEFCLLKQQGLQPQHTVIDAGCGSGRLATQLKDYLTGTYVGLDVVPELFRYAQQACERSDWKFYQAPGTTIPERDASADFVTFFSVFTHLQHEEMYRYLADAKRVLKPGGKIVFSFLEFRIPSHWFIFEHSVKDARPEKVLNQFIDRDMIREFASHLGLEIEEIHDGHIPHIALDRTVRWDSGQEMHGMGNLGQSVCVLRHARVGDTVASETGTDAVAVAAVTRPAPAPIALIADPTKATLPGCAATFLSEETLARRADIRFWDDPYATELKQPQLGESVGMKRYIVELDRSWTLDGHRCFLHPEAGFLADRVVEDREHAHLLLTDTDTNLAFDSESRGFIESRRPKLKVQLSGRVGVATSVEPSNWGSFLTRIVPKAIALRDQGCSKLLVYCVHPRQRELIRQIGWSDDQVIPLNPAYQYVMDTAVYPSEWTNGLYLHPTSLSLLHRLSEGLSISGGKRIYVTRKHGIAARSGRVCTNAEEVEAAMQALGLDVVTPDLLSVEEQIRLFASAELVVGPSGAGMFNAVFCRPGTALVDIESQPDWLWGHANLFSSIGLNFGMCLGDAETHTGEAHRPYRVDASALSDRVRNLL